MHAVSGETADTVWRRAFALLQDSALAPVGNTRTGPTYELLHVHLAIREPLQRWVLSRVPAMNPSFAIAEVVWILTGRKDSAFLNAWNRRLSSFAGSGDAYHGAYGFRLRHHFGLDQLLRAYDTLRRNSALRQVVLQIWDPPADLPRPDGSPVDPDVPCNVCSMLKVRDGRLEWMQIVRSNDVVLGLPYNLIQFTTLQEVLAGWLGVGIGEYHQLSDSLHLYARDRGRFHCESAAGARNTDALGCGLTESERVFGELANTIEILTDPALTPEGLRRKLLGAKLAPAFKNLLLVVASEAARRRGWTEEEHLMVSQCDNPMLRAAWSGWSARCRVRKILPSTG